MVRLWEIIRKGGGKNGEEGSQRLIAKNKKQYKGIVSRTCLERSESSGGISKLNPEPEVKYDLYSGIGTRTWCGSDVRRSRRMRKNRKK